MADSINTSAHDLVLLLRKVGKPLSARERAGLEKVELLDMIGEQIMVRLRAGKKIRALGELAVMLEREGRSVTDVNDGKTLTDELLRFRAERVAQRSHYVKARDATAAAPVAVTDPLMQELQLIPGELVRDCFDCEDDEARSESIPETEQPEMRRASESSAQLPAEEPANSPEPSSSTGRGAGCPRRLDSELLDLFNKMASTMATQPADFEAATMPDEAAQHPGEPTVEPPAQPQNVEQASEHGEQPTLTSMASLASGSKRGQPSAASLSGLEALPTREYDETRLSQMSVPVFGKAPEATQELPSSPSQCFGMRPSFHTAPTQVYDAEAASEPRQSPLKRSRTTPSLDTQETQFFDVGADTESDRADEDNVAQYVAGETQMRTDFHFVQPETQMMEDSDDDAPLLRGHAEGPEPEPALVDKPPSQEATMDTPAAVSGKDADGDAARWFSPQRKLEPRDKRSVNDAARLLEEEFVWFGKPGLKKLFERNGGAYALTWKQCWHACERALKGKLVPSPLQMLARARSVKKRLAADTVDVALQEELAFVKAWRDAHKPAEKQGMKLSQGLLAWKTMQKR